MTHDEALAYLYSRIDYEKATVLPYNVRDFKLDRMRELLARLGNPERGLEIVHVAGTKGKGSTSAAISAVLAAAGYKTGLFSSPHLDRVEERLRIDGEPCSPEEFVELTSRARRAAEEMDGQLAGDAGPSGPTYFELTTAMALLHFVQAGAAFAVLEVGMGGRLDSTNVCLPRVAVITSISFDHTKQLGNTLAAIAGEKAGIVKSGVPCVSGVVQEEPQAVIEAVCLERGSRLVQLGRDFDFDYMPPKQLELTAAHGRMDYRRLDDGRRELLLDVPLALLGRHQAANAAVALAALGELRGLGFSIPEQALRHGLAHVRWPARVEVVGRRPTVILDAAHNVASIDALLATLEESFEPQRRLLIFGTTKDKDARGMLASLLPRFETVIFTQYLKNPRAVPPGELQDLASALGRDDCLLQPDAASAWRAARELARPGDLICITGSFFLAAEMRGEIEGELHSAPRS